MDSTAQCTMCRICMRSDSIVPLIGLFEHVVQTQSLANVVSLVGAVEVQQYDELPKQCCTQCLRDVEAAYKLRNLCQESDVKLRSNLAKPVAVVKKEQLLSDDEFNSQDPEGLTSSNDICTQKEAVTLNSFTPDALKHEYEEITIGETHIIEANYKTDQCSESENTISDDVDENNSNTQELETDTSDNKTRYHNFYKLPKTFDKYPAVKFSCCSCTSCFDTIEELRAHGREEHCDTNLESFTLKDRQCDICFKVLCNGRTYDFHRKNVMYNFRCQICDEVMITLKLACAHYQLKHTRRKRNLTADQALICCGCEMHFSTAEELKIHSETIHLPEKPSADEKKPVTCNICYHNYSSTRGLHEHKVAYLKRRKNHHCKECRKAYRTASELRIHEECHTRTTFQCPQCPKVYFRSASLRDHLHLHSQPADKYRCNQCERAFQRKASLVEHSRSHTGERPYQCVECEKSFNTKRAFDEHTVYAHTNLRPYSCPQCPATFKRKSDLTVHVKGHRRPTT